MERTLFGSVEGKRESIARAKKLAEIYAAIREAPDALDCRRGQIMDLDYFIERSREKKIDPNDRDGLLRSIGDPEDLLTERDCAAMRRNKKLWKPYPTGWLGATRGQLYCCQLHPKEIKYLEGLKAEIAAEVTAIETNLPLLQEEATQLRLIGRLPADVAERHRLTEDGREKLK